MLAKCRPIALGPLLVSCPLLTLCRVLKYRLYLQGLVQSMRSTTMLRSCVLVGSSVCVTGTAALKLVLSRMASAVAQLRRYSSGAEGHASPEPCGGSGSVRGK